MIGVCIKYFHENYGGMLQAFATVKMLESRGIDYELIRYKKKLTITEKIRYFLLSPTTIHGIVRPIPSIMQYIKTGNITKPTEALSRIWK